MCTDSWPFPPTFFNSPFFPIMIIFGPTKSVRTMMSNIFLFTITLLLTHIFIWSWHMFLVGQFCILFLKYLLLSPTCCNWSNFCLVIIFSTPACVYTCTAREQRVKAITQPEFPPCTVERSIHVRSNSLVWRRPPLRYEGRLRQTSNSRRTQVLPSVLPCSRHSLELQGLLNIDIRSFSRTEVTKQSNMTLSSITCHVFYDITCVV